MKAILSIAVAYAVVFAPGCNQRTSSNLQADQKNSYLDQLRTESYQLGVEQGKGFDAILNAREHSLKGVNVYASFQTSTIERVDPKILKNINRQQALTGANGELVSQLFIQSKSGNQTSILGVRYINQIKMQQRAAIIVGDFVDATEGVAALITEVRK